MAAFRQLVGIDLPAKAIRWEVFGTPEYVGGVPGPTDFVTLIAQVSPVQLISPKESATGEVWIAPEAARPWLSSKFRAIFAKCANEYIDISKVALCKPLQGTLRKTGEPVLGVICSDGDTSVVYRTIFDSTV